MFQMSSSGVLCNVCPKALLDEEKAVGTAACSMGGCTEALGACRGITAVMLEKKEAVSTN